MAHKWDRVCDPPTKLHLPVRIDPAGASGPTRSEARGPRWRRIGHGWYVTAAADPTVPEQRIVEAAAHLPADGAVTGWASLRLHGAGLLDGLARDGVTLLPVALAIPARLHRAEVDGITYLRDPLDDGDVTVRHGVRCVRPERAVFDEARRCGDVRLGVMAFDAAAAASLTSLRRTGAYVEQHRRWLGVRLVREVLALADERSWSPAESLVRLVWEVDARYPRPLTNRQLFDRETGRLLGIPDLLDPDAGVVGEIDGGEHAGARRRSRDAGRDGVFRNYGLETFRVTGYDVHRPDVVIDRIRDAYARAALRPQQDWRWTLRPPPGHPPFQTLDEILDERDFLRRLQERWEREPVDPWVLRS